MFLIIAPAKAYSQRGGSEIWGAESSGAYDSRIGGTWRKTANEIQRQQDVSGDVDTFFSDNGYDHNNNQGYYSQKSLMLDDISFNEANYPRVAVVDFDHGVGTTDYMGLSEWHYQVEDNVGTVIGAWPGEGGHYEHGVFDMDIYPRSAEEKPSFVFINTCMSANIASSVYGYSATQGIVPNTDRARGMPFAWTHGRPNIDISGDGYWYPDNSKSVYFGFPRGSAALAQGITMGSSTIDYALWVWKFFEFALTEDITVRQAMNEASQYWFDCDYWETPLYQGFTSNWPTWDPTNGWHNNYWLPEGNDRLVVYGNGNIRLYQEGGIWDFNEGQGTTANDNFVHNNDCTISGASWTSGKSGYALNFDGSNDLVYRYYSSSLNGMPAVTLMEWVKLDTIPSANSVNLGGIPCEYWLEYRSNQYVSLSTYINSQYNGDGFYANLADGNWHLLTMTYDGTYKKGYLDGTLMATYNIPGSLASTNYQFRAGESFPPTQNYNGCPDGIIDEVRVYNYAFSAEQIANEASVLYLHLNGGDYAYDSSPYGNIGTINGASWATGPRTSSGLGYGLSFNGNGYVEVADSNSLDTVNALTIAAWVNMQADHNGGSPTMLRKQGNYLLEVGDAGNNKPAFLLWFTDQTTTRIDGPEIPKYGWHYWVGTYDGNTMRLYIDGSEVASVSVSKSMATSAYPLRIGHYESEWFNGLIDEVSINDRALSSTEISSYYAESRPRHWLNIDAICDEYSMPLYPWISIDGQYTSPIDVTRGDTHTFEVAGAIEDPYYGWFYFDRFTYGGTTNYDNPMTLQISTETQITAHYYWYGW